MSVRDNRIRSFSGTPGMLRLCLRRDRVILPLWVLLLSVPLATVYVASIEKVYPAAAARAALVASIMASPAQRALYGQVYNDSLGATGVWKAGMFHLLIAVAVILTVIRHTRADEESGRAELIESTPVGRYAGLTAALLMSFGASIVTGAIGGAGLMTTDVPPAGSVAFGAALTGSGAVFTAVAAVAAQLSSSARVARAVAFSALAVAFTLRAVGDAGSGTLSWLSPLGWSLQVRPYAGDRWWLLLLHLTAAATLTAMAYRLLARRDVGAGLIADRRGRGTASPLLRDAFGLAWRLDRGSVLVWTAGLVLYGLLIGSVVHGIGDEVGGSTAVRQIVARMGGAGALEQAFVGASFCMLGMVAAAFTVSLSLRAAAGGEQRARRNAAGRCGAPRPLAGKPSDDRPERVGRRAAGGRLGRRLDVRCRSRRCRRQTADVCLPPPRCSCPPCGWRLRSVWPSSGWLRGSHRRCGACWSVSSRCTCWVRCPTSRSGCSTWNRSLTLRVWVPISLQLPCWRCRRSRWR